MLNVKELTDDELAVLAYAIEDFHGDARRGGWYDRTVLVAGDLRGIIVTEYEERGLDFSKYQME